MNEECDGDLITDSSPVVGDIKVHTGMFNTRVGSINKEILYGKAEEHPSLVDYLMKPLKAEAILGINNLCDRICIDFDQQFIDFC